VTRRALFILFHGCEILDFAGPVQALFEATTTGGVPYDVTYCSPTASVTTAQRLTMSALDPLPAVAPDDWIFVPGYSLANTQPPASIARWLRKSYAAGARICSVCTGAFLLGEAGLLDGRRCTTHWKRVAELQQRFPAARVVGDRLFVEDGQLISSAGIAAGIDMTLWMLEQDAGAALASIVAREMVVYLRRDGAQGQTSVYLDHQMHLNPAVHEVQHHLIRHPEAKESLEQIAARVGMSARNLTRVFRRATGISIREYRMRLRLEHARTLLRNPSMTLEAVAAACGFADARQLRRLFRANFGHSPSRFRAG
jgi:transcriptional regulator GlxA family with amidase domain